MAKKEIKPNDRDGDPLLHWQHQRVVKIQQTNNNVMDNEHRPQRTNGLIGERIRCTPDFPVYKQAHLKSYDDYQRLYDRSIQTPGPFWLELAKDFHWASPLPRDPDQMFKWNFDINAGTIKVEFMKNVKTNITYNLLDRIINRGFGDRIAYYWQGNEVNESQQITYRELRRRVCRFANVLRRMGVTAGDRVAIYLPVTIELVIAMLACARIGAVHTVVFAGFSAPSLADRLVSAGARILVAADASFRGEKFLHFQPIVDEAVAISRTKGLQLQTVVMVGRFEQSVNRNKSQYQSVVDAHQSPIESIIEHWDLLIDAPDIPDECEPAWLDGEHPLFILYTSGSTGKPKGMLHTVAGYMLTTATVFKYAFNYVDGDIFFCTADLGWITGHTANVYGPLANGATSILFEGIPTYPKPDRLWSIIDQYRANVLYTAPTAVRSLMKFGDHYPLGFGMKELKLIALVGEPINRDAWMWVFQKIGRERCPIVDTYFQTETGAPMIFPVPVAIDMKPGSATVPFFGIWPVVLDENGKEIADDQQGFLAFRQAWPSLARTVDGNHERYEATYFERFPGYYFTGDGGYRDQDGYFWITGRTDDLLNVSGHLLSTSEVESCFLKDKRIAEAAAVPMPHAIKGQCICVFVVAKNGYEFDAKLESDLRSLVRKDIGPVATPDLILGVRGLPKTRSGKIMRRVLAKIACGEKSDFGDISTITDETIIEHLIQVRLAHSG